MQGHKTNIQEFIPVLVDRKTILKCKQLLEDNTICNGVNYPVALFLKNFSVITLSSSQVSPTST